MSSVDLLIVGAGPAGMAAVVAARRSGLDVVVVDDQPAPGGQIWRSVETVAAAPRGAILGESYQSGLPFAEAFRASGARYEPGAQLWQIEPGFRAFVSRDRKAKTIDAKAVLLATGAQERPVPFPGWTLPGVLTVGAAQILLKSSGQIPDKPVWVAGSGPLPLLYMTQLLRAGGKIAGYLDTTPPGRMRAALPYLPGALRATGDLLKGLAWTTSLKKSGIPIIKHVADIEAIGTEQIEAIRYRTAEGREQTVPADILLVHEGVVPSIHAVLALNCAVEWRDDQDCYVPVLDQWGETSQANLFVAGDGAGIAGGTAAHLRGELAGLRIAEKLGRLSAQSAEERAKPLRRRLDRELALRPFLDALFKPRAQIFAPADETIVCRCEEITARDIRAMAKVGQPGPNQVKAFTRAGMGPCQGRQCGYTVTRILAAAEGRPAADVGFYRVRPPLKPVSLGELASLQEEKTLQEATP
jgi:NADPH-dependent 2,4-dienoyl-CoA reductase/sulfur reductase-like enzyme